MDENTTITPLQSETIKAALKAILTPEQFAKFSARGTNTGGK